MPTWIDMIRRELEEMPDANLYEPHNPIEFDDRIAGEANVELRRLFTLSVRFEDLICTSSGSNCILSDAELRQKANTLRAIFWVSIRDEFKLWDKNPISIRRGWKIAWSNRQRDNPDKSRISELYY